LAAEIITMFIDDVITMGIGALASISLFVAVVGFIVWKDMHKR
jgi:hypothetical protein